MSDIICETPSVCSGRPKTGGGQLQRKLKDIQRKTSALTLRLRCGRCMVRGWESTDDLSVFCKGGVTFVITKNTLQCIWTADGR